MINTKIQELLKEGNTKKAFSLVKKCGCGITHDGIFHLDDVLLAALLKITNPNTIIDRTRDEKTMQMDGFVFDEHINGEFNLFDHHYDKITKPKNSFGEPHCSVSSFWEQLGKEFLIDYGIEERFVDRLHKRLTRFFDIIAAEDNGIKKSTNEVLPLGYIINIFNPCWNEISNRDVRFDATVDFIIPVFKRLIAKELSFVAGEEIVEKAIKVAIDNKKQYIVLDKPIQWQEIILKKYSDKDLLFGIVHMDKEYCVTGCLKEPGSNERKLYFPEDWGGITPEQMKEELDINDFIFCHPDRFILKTKSLESAIELVERAIEHRPYNDEKKNFVYKKFYGKLRKNYEPAYTHSFNVFEKLKAIHAPEDVCYAGLGHDLIEDTDTTFEELKTIGWSDESIRLIDLATEKKEDGQTLDEFITQWSDDYYADMIKGADRLDNTESMLRTAPSDYFVAKFLKKSTKYIAQFRKSNNIFLLDLIVKTIDLYDKAENINFKVRNEICTAEELDKTINYLRQFYYVSNYNRVDTRIDYVNNKQNCAFMVFYTDDNQPWLNYEELADESFRTYTVPTVLILNRFKGKLGFPGGNVEIDESVVKAVKRECLEEIAYDNITDFEKLSVYENNKMAIHTFVKKLSSDEFIKLSKNIVNAKHYGSEITGIISEHIYTTINSNVKTILEKPFAGSAKEELIALMLTKI